MFTLLLSLPLNFVTSSPLLLPTFFFLSSPVLLFLISKVIPSYLANSFRANRDDRLLYCIPVLVVQQTAVFAVIIWNLLLSLPLLLQCK